MPADPAILTRLMQVILERKTSRPERSYTTTLLDAGLPKIGGKITEEAAELVEAAGEPDAAGRDHTIREAADLVYHMLVLLAWRDCTLAEVEAELARRFGLSGLDEKAARPPAESK
jgi:phosphoribosyl-ATP pyrophosphohydrolase